MTTTRTANRPAAGRARAPIPPGLARQERQRLSLLRRLAKAREKASSEIERLIRFLDDTDVYVLTELEIDNAEPSDDEILEAAGGWLAPGEDDEPSLGWTKDGSWGDGRMVDGERDDSDLEPALGWTIDGHLGGHRDLEEECHDEGVNDDSEADREDGPAFPEAMDQTVTPAAGMRDGIGGVMG